MSEKSEKHICPMCGRQSIPPRKVKDALLLVKNGVSQSVAARATGISRQRLNQILKFNKSKERSGK